MCTCLYALYIKYMWFFEEHLLVFGKEISKNILNRWKIRIRINKIVISGFHRDAHVTLAPNLTLILRRSRTGMVWFYTSTSNKRAARPKLYTKSLTRDLKRMYSRLTLVRISINL